MLLTLSFAQAQQPISVQVDRTTLSTDETLAMTVEINTSRQNPPAPTLPVFDSFTVVGQSTSSQVSIVNGAVSAKVLYQYRLQPQSAGTLTIPSISLTLDGETYSSDPITVEVTQGQQAAPQPDNSAAPTDGATQLSGQDFYVEGVVTNSEPYLGEQISYLFRFYQALEVRGQIQYQEPDFAGFWNERQPDQTQTVLQSSNRTYRLTELSSILFPTIVGTATIEVAELQIPGQSLQTQPVPVTVRPLPDGAPDAFNGAVGQFQIMAQLDQTESQVNEPLTLLVTLRGQGNIGNLPDPIWPDIPNWRIFESKAVINTETQDGRLGGSREYEVLLVPSQPGEFNLPSIEYSYFDPQAENYLTIGTQPIAVTITPADAQAPSPVVVGTDREAVTRLATDIRFLKPLPTQLSTAPPPLTETVFYWGAWLVPLMLLLASWGQQRYQPRDPSARRKSQARRQAKQRLQTVRRQNLDPYTEGEATLYGYLADKLGQPVSGLTQTQLRDLLRQRGVSEAHIDQTTQMLETCHIGRYALGQTAAADGQAILMQLDQLVDALEKELTQ